MIALCSPILSNLDYSLIMDITNNTNSSLLCDQCKDKLTIRSYCLKCLNKYKLISKRNKKKAVNAQQKEDVKDFYKCENCVGKLIKDLCRQCRTLLKLIKNRDKLTLFVL